MATEEIIFKHPPATEVQIVAGFHNIFAVADHRSRFHKLVYDEFPAIVMPERSKVPLDLGDYTLHAKDGATRLEIGMNYFRLVSLRYPGFKKFREQFLGLLKTFADCYEIKQTFYLLSMSFRNDLPLTPNFQYKDCFTLKISFSMEPEPELFAGQGFLVYKKPEGLITIQLEPKVENAQVQAYTMNLLFTTNRNFSEPFDRELIPQLTDTAHDYLKGFFLGMLTKQYVEFLGAR